MQIEMSGRLGNQMYQYAFLLHLQKMFPNEKVLINMSSLKCERNRLYVSEVFDLDINVASGLKSVSRVRILPYSICRLLNVKDSLMNLYVRRIITEENIEVSTIDKNSYFKGYWQSERYFFDVKDEVLKSFRFKNVEDDKNVGLMKIINNTITIAVHVRRSDYLLNKNRNEYACLSETQYYKNALNNLYNNRKTLIVFSDDIVWCKDFFKDYNSIFVDWNNGDDSWKDMYLMTKCDSVIIANSSFSWWGAYLNGKQDIYYPNKSYLGSGKNIDRYPKNWNPVEIY